jgi:hypothetical protein
MPHPTTFLFRLVCRLPRQSNFGHFKKQSLGLLGLDADRFTGSHELARSDHCVEIIKGE